MRGVVVAPTQEHYATGTSGETTHNKSRGPAGAVVVDAEVRDARNIGDVRYDGDDRFASIARVFQRDAHSPRVWCSYDQASAAVGWFDNRLDERSLVCLTNNAAVDKDSLVQNRAGARERTSQAQEERRPVVREQDVDVDQFVGGARQNPGYAEPLGRGDHFTSHLVGGAAALVQDAVDG